MCGRYSIWLELLEMQRLLDALPSGVEFRPTANVSPTQPAPIAVGRPERRIGLARFGFSLPDRGDGTKPPFVINARSETAASSFVFRESVARRRCVVPADGYYEWRVEDGARQPYFVRAEAPLLFAGLYRVQASTDVSAREPAFVILTREAEGAQAKVHERMPVVVAREALDAWLDPSRADARPLREVLAAPRPRVEVVPVSRRVSKAAEQGAELREPIGPALPDD